MTLADYLNLENKFNLCVKSGNLRHSSSEDKLGNPILGIITHGLPYAVGYISFTVNDCNYKFEYLLQTNRGQTYSLYISSNETDTLSLIESIGYRSSTWNGKWYPITDIKIAMYYFTELLLKFLGTYNVDTDSIVKYNVVFENDCETDC